MSTADDTFAADPAPCASREARRFGRIVVVGGGCYGGYYVRQLGRAARAGALAWDELTVVDRDAGCAVGRLAQDVRPPRLELIVAPWEEFFRAWLASAAERAEMHAADAIVPSPLMPHLMADWLTERARTRWPGRTVRTIPPAAAPPVPWHRLGDDGTQYVSFAEWMCPINCIEPAKCPKTRGERTWSMPVALGRHAAAERATGRAMEEPLLFHCAHRAYGVGMIDVSAVLAADDTIATTAAASRATFLVGTVSHCHGALRGVEIGDPPVGGA